MKELKSKKGITLIALVITIIVLIILAGISISIMMGEDGLITKAKQGAQNYQNAAIEEQAMLNTVYGKVGTQLANGSTNNGSMPVNQGETTHTETYNLAATDTGTTDLGVNHSYRYINAANVYNKGLTDGQSAPALTTEDQSFTVPKNNYTTSTLTYHFDHGIVGIAAISNMSQSYRFVYYWSIDGNNLTISAQGINNAPAWTCTVTCVGY